MSTSSSLPIGSASQAPSHSAPALQRTDAELLEAWHLDVEHVALAALVEKYAGLVLSVCRRQCRDAHDVEDAFQATFLQLARHAGKIRHPEALAGWLHCTAYRVAVRARDRQLQEVQPLLEDPPDPSHPLEQVARRHELRVLDEELAALPSHHRAALALHFLEGRSLAQTAHQLGTSIGTVRGRLQRAKAQLRTRLRRRGVVPGAVVAALAIWPADPAAASALSDQFLQGIPESGGLPDASSAEAPENLTPSLQPLLQSGDSAMSLSSLVLGGVASAMLGLVLLAGLLPGESSGRAIGKSDGNAGAAQEITLRPPPEPTVLAQFGGAIPSPEVTPPAQSTPTAPAAAAPAAGPSTGNAGMQGRPGVPAARAPEPKPPSATAQRILDALDQPLDIKAGQMPVSDLESLGSIINLPVLVDQRGIEAAEVQGKSVRVDSSAVPLRTALRKMLRPLALKAIVTDDGLLVTADTAELARRGVGTSQWVNIDNEAAARIDAKLDETSNLPAMFEEPLEQAVRMLSEQMEIPVLLDRRALEEVGLTQDTPVTINLQGVSYRTFLKQMLADLDLTYVNRGELLTVTTVEAAESRLLSRIYWLDATGIYGDFSSLMMAIQSTVEPHTWDTLGGPSSMTPVSLENRGALLISATTEVHHEIEQLLDLMRQNYFGEAAGFHSKPATKVPEPQPGMGMGGFGGGVGGGGMM